MNVSCVRQLLYRQASNTLSLRKCMNISPFSVWALISDHLYRNWWFLQSFLMKLWKSCVAIRAIVIKTTTGMSFWASPVCWTLESLQLLNWAIHWFELYLKWYEWQFGTIDKYGTSLFQQYTIQSACNTHQILLVSTILDFWTPNFKATGLSTLLSICFENSQSDWKHDWKMLCAVLWKYCMQFWNYAPLKVAPLFLDHPI